MMLALLLTGATFLATPPAQAESLFDVPEIKLAERRINTRSCHYRVHVPVDEATSKHPRIGIMLPSRARLLPTSPHGGFTSSRPEVEGHYFSAHVLLQHPFDKISLGTAVRCDLLNFRSDIAMLKHGYDYDGVPLDHQVARVLSAEIELQEAFGVKVAGARFEYALETEFNRFAPPYQTDIWLRFSIPISPEVRRQFIASKRREIPRMRVWLTIEVSGLFRAYREIARVGPFPVDTTAW